MRKDKKPAKDKVIKHLSLVNPLNTSQLMRLTGLSKPSVNQAIRELEKESRIRISEALRNRVYTLKEENA